MTRIEFFTSGKAMEGVKLGIVPVDFLVKYDVYLTYVEFRNQASGRYQAREAQARLMTVEKTKYGYQYVCRVIRWFEADFHKAEKRQDIILPTFNRSKDKFPCTCTK